MWSNVRRRSPKPTATPPTTQIKAHPLGGGTHRVLETQSCSREWPEARVETSGRGEVRNPGGASVRSAEAAHGTAGSDRSAAVTEARANESITNPTQTEIMPQHPRTPPKVPSKEP